jgi:hypothetical protein
MRTSIALLLACVPFAFGQTPPAPKPTPDTLTLTSGEKLIGHFLRSAGGNVVFKSDALGELTIAWAKVKDLQPTGRYVVIGKNVKLTRRTDTSSLPKGALAEEDQTLSVLPAPGAPPLTIPVVEAAYVVDEATFQNELFHNPGFFESWNGTVTGGASIVQATQQARTFTGGVSLVRAVPPENWLDPRNRTLFDFSASEGFVIQPGTQKIRTAIYRVDAERDEYLRGKDLYGFVATSFDHNYSQGLDLQSNVGGGLGYTVIKKANESLDFKGSITYINQNFEEPAKGYSLVGSNFIETFTRKTGHGILFLEQIAVTPAWSMLNAYSWSAGGAISIPVFKRFAFTTRASDSFINNPPPSFKKNSFQLTTGLTYTLR